MDIRISAIFYCAAVLLALAACQESAASGRPHREIDSISRNVNDQQGGSVTDPMKMEAPPIHRDYVEDR